MAKTPEEMEAAMIANMPEKTGKSLEEWITIAQQSSLAKHGQIVGLLKKEHGMGHGFANLVAHYTLRGGTASAAAPTGDDLVAAQYAGAKAGLRPIYDALLARVTALGDDVEVSPKKTYVSLRRSKQFALVQPSTRTRVDVGIKLPGVSPTDRLENSGSFNAMVTHRVRVTELDQVDDELAGWLQQAYEGA